MWLAAKRCRYCDTALDTFASYDPPSLANQSQRQRTRRHSIKGKERQDFQGEDGLDYALNSQEDLENRGSELLENIANESKKTISECCTAPECVAKARIACTRSHAECGHPCDGIRGEEICPPCLHTDCAREGRCNLFFIHLFRFHIVLFQRGFLGAGSQSGTDLCLICYVEELRAAPCVQLACGHLFHSKCSKDKIVNGWSGKFVPPFLNIAAHERSLNFFETARVSHHFCVFGMSTL